MDAKEYKTIKVYSQTRGKLKVVAAYYGMKMADFAEMLIDKKYSEMVEDQAEKAIGFLEELEESFQEQP